MENSGLVNLIIVILFLQVKTCAFDVVIVSIDCRHGLRIEAHHRKQPNKSKLALYTIHYFTLSHLIQLYISNKTECFSYKGGYGVMHIEAFKRRAGSGYR